jgi:hypothetical protein
VSIHEMGNSLELECRSGSKTLGSAQATHC